MTNEQINYLQDTLEHKALVLLECFKLYKWLIEKDELDIAEKLAKSCMLHDNSKITILEYEKMSLIPTIANITPMIDPESLPTKETKEILKIHWLNNRHHPEHFKNANDMKKEDIAEMVCDWAARSKQYNTNLLDFAKKRLENRFSYFNEQNKKLILEYCEVLSR